MIQLGLMMLIVNLAIVLCKPPAGTKLFASVAMESVPTSKVVVQLLLFY